MDVVSDDVQMAIVIEELSKSLDVYVRENSDRIRPFSQDDLTSSLQLKFYRDEAHGLLSSGKNVSFYFSGLPSDFQFCSWAVGVFCKHGGVVCVVMPDDQLRFADMDDEKTWQDVVTLEWRARVVGWIDL